MSLNSTKRRQTGKVCANCTITVSPVWRHAKGLDLTLCNACHICWVTKGVHRPIPPPEILAKIVAAATKKAEAPAQSDRQQGHAASRSASSSDTEFVGGKRKRVAKKWGTDIDTYGEGSLGRADSEESMDQELLISMNATAFDQTPIAQQMNIFDAAKVMMTFKKARYNEEEPAPPIQDNVDPDACTHPARKGSAKKDCSVTLTVEGKRKRIPKAFDQFKPNEQKRCQNCGVTETPVWRKAGGQYPLCNACGVSKRAHGVDRKPPSASEIGSEDQAIPETQYSQEVDIVGDDSTTFYAPFQTNLPSVPQVTHMHERILHDFCPLRVASPMVRCQPQQPVMVEKMGMRRNLFGMAMKSCAMEENAGDSLDSTTYFA